MLGQRGFLRASEYLLIAVCLLTEVSACALLRLSRREISIVSSIEVPPTVKAQEPFTIIVHTPSGGPTKPDKVEVRVSGLSAEIIPYDAIEQSHINYLMSRIDSPRSVSLQFDTPGIGIIRIIGRGAQEQPTLHQETVNVLPP